MSIKNFKIGKTYKTIFGTEIKVDAVCKDNTILYHDMFSHPRNMHIENFEYEKQGVPKEIFKN